MPSADSPAQAVKPSLRSLLVRQYGLLVLAGLLVLGGGVYLLVRHHLYNAHVQRSRLAVMSALRQQRREHNQQARRSGQQQRHRHPGRQRRRRSGEGERRLLAPPDFDRARAKELARAIAEPRVLVRIFSPDGGNLARAGARRVDLELSQAGTQTQLYSDVQGRKWLLVSLPLVADSDAHELLAWVVVGELFHPSQDLLDALWQYEVLVGLIALMLVVGLGFALAVPLSRPLEQLSEAALAVAGGDLSARPETDAATGEMVQLQRAFTLMVDRLEQSLTSQKRFLADASHELKTPLTAIGGMTEMLRRQGSEKDRELALETIEREVERMGVLVGDLLALSRAESLALETEVGELAPILKAVVATLEVNHPERTVRLHCADGLKARFHAGALQQVLLNLLENALRYSSDEAEVEVLASKTAGGGVEIEIKDRGIGMSPAELERVFERFFRADPARARHTGGSGLGLAIVKALTEAMGGKVTLDSQNGVGTTATLLL